MTLEEQSKYIAPLSALISVIALVLARSKAWSTGDGSIAEALSGDLKALQMIAFKVVYKRWVLRFFVKNTRRDVVHALCLAWSTELPPYTRALIFDALANIWKRGQHKRVNKELEKIGKRFKSYEIIFGSKEFVSRLEQNELLLKKLNEITLP